MNQDKEKERCFRYILFLLGGRDYSSYQLIKKALDKDYSKDIIDQVVDKLIELDYINNDRY